MQIQDGEMNRSFCVALWQVALQLSISVAEDTGSRNAVEKIVLSASTMLTTSENTMLFLRSLSILSAIVTGCLQRVLI